MVSTSHPFLEAADYLFRNYTTAGERPEPTEADDPKKLKALKAKFHREQDRARFSLADLVASTYRDGLAITDLEKAIREMVAVRGRRIMEHEYHRARHYLPTRR